MSTYSQDLVVINGMMRGDQRIVGNREFSEDERWLYRIEPGSGAPRLTRTLPRVTMPLAPVRPQLANHLASSRGSRSSCCCAAASCSSSVATPVRGGCRRLCFCLCYWRSWRPRDWRDDGWSCRHEPGHCPQRCVVYEVVFPDSPQRFRSSPASWDVGPYGRSGPCRERVDRRCRGAVVGAVGWRGSWVVGAPIHWLT